MRHPSPLALGLALLAALPTAASAGRGERGNGKLVTQQRDVGGTFDSISLRGSLDARVTVGPAITVAVTVDENVQPRVITRLEGSTLVVEQQDLRASDGAFVAVTLPELRSFASSGSGDARIEGSKGGDLSLATSGSGEITWRGEAGALSIATQGSGDVELEGRAASVSIATSGSGDVDAGKLTVKDAEASSSGSGDVSVTVDGGTLRARTSGSGDITYRGSARVDARTSGSGEVIAK